MSILHYNMNQSNCGGLAQAPLAMPAHVKEYEERNKRNPVNDLKEGIDLVFELKDKISTSSIL